jgi:MFS family permease
VRIRNDIVLVFLCSSSFFLSYFGRLVWGVVGVYSPLRPTIGESALVLSLFFVSYIIVQLPAGMIADRIKPNLTAGIAMFGLAFGFLLAGLAPSIKVEYASSIEMGLFAGWIWPATLKIMTSLFAERSRRVVMMGYYSLAWPLSLILLGILVPPITLGLGWNWTYYFLAITSILLGGLMILSEVRGFVSEKITFSPVLNRNSLMIILGGLGFFFAYWPLSFFAYDYFVSIGLGPYQAGVAVSALALAGIPSTILSGHVMNKLGIKRTMLLSLVAYGTLFFLLTRVFTFYDIIAVALVMGFVRFFITPANSNIISVVGETRAGSLSGVTNLAWQVSGIIAPVYSAYLINLLGYTANWEVMCLVVFASTIAYALIVIPKPKPVTIRGN